MFKSFNVKNVVWVLLMVSFTLLAYQSSFQVPFYLDDIGSIVNNPNFKNASFSSLLASYEMRAIGYYTFFLDFQLHKLSVAGYHYTNFAIHCLNGVMVYSLMQILLSLTWPQATRSRIYAISAGLAMLFLLHPLNTQAVTYIVQRLSSLATLFYLLCIISYLRFRTTTVFTGRLGWSFLALVAAASAIFTKQNAVSLPLILLTFEYIFFNKNLASKVFKIGCFVIVAVVLIAILMPNFAEPYLSHFDRLTRETTSVSRLNYFYAQLSILWVYIGKFFWPVGLHLEYSNAFSELSAFVTLCAGVAHVAVLGLAFFARRRLPMLTIGISFFYFGHIVESSIIPIRDLMFEHRTYLPNIGLLIVIGSLIHVLFDRRVLDSRRSIASLGLVAVVILSTSAFLTHERNEQWLDPEKFYENELKYSPKNIRVLHNYAEYAGRMGQLEKSEKLIDKMYEMAETYYEGKLDGNMVNTHVVLLMSKGRFRDALRLAKNLLREPYLHPRTRSHVLSNIGIIYTTFGRYERAEDSFDEAYSNAGMTPKSLVAYAFVLIKNRKHDLALEVINEIKRIEPENPKLSQLEEMIDEASVSKDISNTEQL